MPVKNQKWSVSRWQMYADCPAQYEWHYVLKNKRGSSPALERGIDIHKKAENFVKGEINGLPNELGNFSSEFKNLKKEYKAGKGYTEPDISVTSDLSASSKFKSDWFIGFADFVHFGDELTVIDYKTGKKYAKHQDQGHAYSMALLILNPDIKRINVEFWYLDIGDHVNNTKEFSYCQKDLPRMLKLWDKRIKTMYSDRTYEATPHKYCGSCMRNVKNGGDCAGK